jgi:hypothetical protein
LGFNEIKMAKLSAAELAKREDVIQKMKKNKRSLVKRYGPDAEKVMYGRATNIAKKVAEIQMEKSNLKELVRAALMKEKAGFSKEYDDNPALKGGQKNLPDGLQKSIIDKAANEDLDLGHEDNEPHMIKAELYRIGKYAMELYQMVDEFEGQGEVDFPAWWQSKITTSANNMVSAKHYLDFETKEPEIDAMVGAIDMSGALDNIGVEDEIEEIGMFHDPRGYKKSEPNPKDLVYTKEYKGNGVYDILKNGKKIATVDGEGNANAYINKLKRELEDEISEGLLTEGAGSALLLLFMVLKGSAGAGLVASPIAGLVEYFFYELPAKRLKAKMLKLFKDPSKRQEVLAMAKEVESYLSPGQQRYLKGLVNSIGTKKIENEISQAYITIDDYIFNKHRMIKSGEWEDYLKREKEFADRRRANIAKAKAEKEKQVKENIDSEISAYVKANPIPSDVEEGLPKGYWSKKIEGGVDESYEALVKKIKGQSKSEKAAKAIAGAVASYKAKGGGKGPTAKQKARG